MDTGDEDTEEQRRKGLHGMIAGGLSLTGQGAAGAIAFLAGGPAGAAVLGVSAAIVADAFDRVGLELADRALGKRERVRVGSAFVLATEVVRLRLDQGEKLRTDGFFDADAAETVSAFDEVMEATLLKAQQEAEERKLPFMANLLASFAFEEISREYAHALIKIADRLSFRQLLLVGLAIEGQEETRMPWSFGEVEARAVFEIEVDARELMNANLAVSDHLIENRSDVDFRSLKLTPLGSDLRRMMRLGDVATSEIDAVRASIEPYLLGHPDEFFVKAAASEYQFRR